MWHTLPQEVCFTKRVCQTSIEFYIKLRYVIMYLSLNFSYANAIYQIIIRILSEIFFPFIQKIPIRCDYNFAYATRADSSGHLQIMIWRDNRNKKNTVKWMFCAHAVFAVSGLCEIRLNTVRCHYNAVNFLRNPHNTHPIARPWGRDMGCLLCFQYLIHFLPLLSQCRM